MNEYIVISLIISSVTLIETVALKGVGRLAWLSTFEPLDLLVLKGPEKSELRGRDALRHENRLFISRIIINTIY